MQKLKVAAFSISIDGFGAGPNQTLNNPLGERGMELHKWALSTKTFQQMHGDGGGDEGIDNDFSARSFNNIGAWILGRNMFGPIRGPWPDEKWRGWWGENPPYHCPVFVLTNYPRKPLVMEGGTTFYFITDGIHSALEMAMNQADGKDVRLGGGSNTIRQFLSAGLIDEMHIAVSPVILGKGESLFEGFDLPSMGYKVTEYISSANALHLVLKK
jgi:dihydrofolate reductase